MSRAKPNLRSFLTLSTPSASSSPNHLTFPSSFKNNKQRDQHQQQLPKDFNTNSSSSTSPTKSPTTSRYSTRISSLKTSTIIPTLHLPIHSPAFTSSATAGIVPPDFATPPASPPASSTNFHSSPLSDSLSQPISLPSVAAARFSLSSGRFTDNMQSTDNPQQRQQQPKQIKPVTLPSSTSDRKMKQQNIKGIKSSTSAQSRPKKRRTLPNNRPTAVRFVRSNHRTHGMSRSPNKTKTKTNNNNNINNNNNSSNNSNSNDDNRENVSPSVRTPMTNQHNSPGPGSNNHTQTGHKSPNGTTKTMRHLSPVKPPDDKTLSACTRSHLRYGTFGLRAGFLRQDSRPLAFLPMKAHRYARLQGTLLSLAKGPYGEVIWSFDVAGSVVETIPDDRKIIIYIVDSQRKKRRVMVLTTPDGRSFLTWSLWLSRASKSVLEMHYSMNRLINKGAFARVVLGKDLHTGEQVAIKLIEKSNAPPSERKYFEREVKIMQTLSHRNIVKCYDVFDSRLRTRIVMEYVEGGTLSDLINSYPDVGLPETVAKRIIKDILSGVKYLHDNGTIHRDLKPDNCLLSKKKAPFGPCKIADFGLASIIDGGHRFGHCSFVNDETCTTHNENNKQKDKDENVDDMLDEGGENIEKGEAIDNEQGGVLSSAVGSPAFVAPEIFEAKYGTAVDIWSCGVILYMMLSGGVIPFKGKSTSEMISHAKKGEIDFSTKALRHVSDQAKHLVKSLLNGDRNERLTAREALGHPWLRNAEPYPTNDTN